MGEKYEMPVADLFASAVSDLAQGTTKAAPMLRDVVDAAIKGGFLEPPSDLLLTQFPQFWNLVVRVSSGKLAGITIPAETP